MRPIVQAAPALRTLRRVVLVWAVLSAMAAALLYGAGAARAETGVDEIAQALRSSPVYVDPAASDKLSAPEARDLAERVRDSRVPLFVAVLPDDPAYGGAQIFDRLRTAVGRPGVYAVALGSQFGAASDASVLPPRTAQTLAAQNLREHPDQPSAILDGFTADVAAAASGAGAGAGTEEGAGSRGGAGAASLVTMLVLLGLLAGGALFAYRRSAKRRREQEREELELVRGVVEEDITAYGETLDRLDFAPADPASTPEMLDDYGRALDAYEEAKQKSEAARRPEDVRSVTEALDGGRFSLAVLNARRRDEPLPHRRPPCFFDPRHGLSVKDAEWAPEGGAERTVPVCAADATRIADGEEPAVRTVAVGDGRRPYYDAGPAYGPWAGGYYGSALLPGLLIGTMLGGSMGHGYGWDQSGHDAGGGDYGGGFGDGGFGDGGGGFGGGFDGGGGGF